MGTRMQSGIHRLQDLALESLALHTVGAWLLHDDEQGRRHLTCVPLSHTDSSVQAGGWVGGSRAGCAGEGVLGKWWQPKACAGTS